MDSNSKAAILVMLGWILMIGDYYNWPALSVDSLESLAAIVCFIGAMVVGRPAGR